jgi:hypothetical protein
MAESDADRLHADYKRYDACVDIVSAAEVWFTVADDIRTTVAHFERFPSIRHPDGALATPDFTVLFEDCTAYVGELSNLARNPASLDSLCHQLGRYDSLTDVQGSTGKKVAVSAVDVILFVPQGEANAAVARIAEAMEDPGHPYSPSRFPTVFGWSFERERTRYVFSLARGEVNQRPRGHGRAHSLEKWMSGGSNPDTLTGMPRHFERFKIASRFMNDSPPALYMAMLLWSDVFPRMSGGEGDISTSAAEVGVRLQADYGHGRASDVEPALELLRVAGLARRSGDSGWRIVHQPITHHDEDVAETLLSRFKSRPSGPVTFAEKERRKKARAESRANKARQTDLES